MDGARPSPTTEYPGRASAARFSLATASTVGSNDGGSLLLSSLNSSNDLNSRVGEGSAVTDSLVESGFTDDSAGESGVAFDSAVVSGVSVDTVGESSAGSVAVPLPPPLELLPESEATDGGDQQQPHE